MIALALAAAVAVAVATGRFDVALQPAAAPDAAITAFTIAKTFHGDLAATAAGEMLSAGDPAKRQAGYVAMERVTGTLAGRAGSFVLLHRGTLAQGGPDLSVTVLPGSGTGALAGIAGSMEIDAAHGHAYTFRYALPGR